MDHAACSLRLLLHELADRLVNGLGFDVSHCSAHFDDRDGIISVPCSHIEPALDLICDMGDDLNCASAIVAPALFVEDGPVYFARRNVAVVVKTLVNEALIMAQVKVCLRSVVCHKDLTVLDRVHRSGIDIQVGIKLLHGHLIAAGLQKAPQ